MITWDCEDEDGEGNTEIYLDGFHCFERGVGYFGFLINL